MHWIVVVVIPALNEEKAISLVIKDIPKQIVSEIIVVDNGSTDQTTSVAKAAGATVILEGEKGYGAACLRGIYYLQSKANKPDIVVFMDADYSDFGGQLPDLIRPILDNNYEMVIGSRTLGKRQKGSMTFSQVFGNWLSTKLIWWLYKTKYTDLGPFRAIRYDSLIEMEMEDRNFGWTVEMQLKAAKRKLRVCEIPVDYRSRVGISKVSGTVKGTILAGYKILATIFKYL
ncbi:MAG: glycosyltransferase family 2 protein [Flavisolibacter sp.]